jgi:hypothetical protein
LFRDAGEWGIVYHVTGSTYQRGVISPTRSPDKHE